MVWHKIIQIEPKMIDEKWQFLKWMGNYTENNYF